MTRRCFQSLLTGLVLLVLLPSVGLSEEKTIPELEQQLKLRDEAIIELLERVNALEKRTGVQRNPKNSSNSARQDSPTSTDQHSSQSPGAVIVKEGDAERALERSLTVEGALLLPAGVVEIEPGIAYTRYEDTAPGFTTIGSNVFASETEVNANIYTASMLVRWGLPWRSQLELGKSYRKIETEVVTQIDFDPSTSTNQTRSDEGDLRIGFAKTLLHEDLSLPDLVGRITWDSDTGGDDSFEELQLSFTAIKRQDPVTFIGGLSYQETIEKNDIEPGAAVTFNLGGLIALNPETSMRFSLSAFSQRNTRQNGEEIDGSDRFAASFFTGGSTLLARGMLLNLSIGIGLTDDADDFSVAVSLPMRF